MAERPEWLADPIGAANRTRVGVVVGVTNESVPLIHAGLLYWEPGETPRVLHLAFHVWLRDQELPNNECRYFWAELPVDEDSAATIAGHIRNVRDLSPKVPYGILYEGGRFAEDGTALLEGRTVGLTCATFVLAVLSTANYQLIDIDTWQPRSEDGAWHDYIVEMLMRYRQGREQILTVEHIDRVRRERGCVRYRPEDVAVATQLQPWPAAFASVKDPSQLLRDSLLEDKRSASIARLRSDPSAPVGVSSPLGRRYIQNVNFGPRLSNTRRPRRS